MASRKRSKKKNPPPDGAARVVQDLVLAGCGRDQILVYLRDGELKYLPDEESLAALIEGALEAIKTQADEYAEHADAMAVVRLNDLFTRAVVAQDIKTALDVQKAITRYNAARTASTAPPAASSPPAAERPTAAEVAAPEGPRAPGGYSSVMGKHRGARRA